VIADEIKYQQSLLDFLPPSPEDEESSKFNNLMSQSEQKWLIKIQAKQMHSDNPYVDDFYAHALVRKRAAMMRATAAAHPAGRMVRMAPTPHGPMPMGKHRREAVQQARSERAPYKPVQVCVTCFSPPATPPPLPFFS
jgi:hypothetical protein